MTKERQEKTSKENPHSMMYKTKTSIYIPNGVKYQFQQLALKNGYSMSNYIIQLINKEIKEQQESTSYVHRKKY